METPIFSEIQRYATKRMRIIAVILFVTALLMLCLLVFLRVNHHQSFSKVPVLLLFTIIPVLQLIGALLILISRLEVNIFSDRLEYKYMPLMFSWQVIQFSEIYRCELKEYRPVAGYGGGGLSTRVRLRDKSYLLQSKFGARFELNNGKIIILGTNRIADMRKALGEVASRGVERY